MGMSGDVVITSARSRLTPVGGASITQISDRSNAVSTHTFSFVLMG
eukprot:CAMPEP_0194275222 /NCGR_PEP_ID=MMETSP0169-20130528/8121_1 /TAXON_ID=218684 /ORGANISM="Corethron pennatum, Strain L29A3" /LENGTH=45 /DNA_ID= /DNA_START= /DNA_END= /DNA_ORIENTATION=